jgi:hypothetical protein
MFYLLSTTNKPLAGRSKQIYGLWQLPTGLQARGYVLYFK